MALWALGGSKKVLGKDYPKTLATAVILAEVLYYYSKYEGEGTGKGAS
jgi:hypothetical protein